MLWLNEVEDLEHKEDKPIGNGNEERVHER